MDAQENKIFIAILIAVVLIGSIIIFFITSSLKQQKKVLKLERENAKAEITVLEKDRERISNDIHDDLSPMLVSIKMTINSFELSSAADQLQLDKTNDTLNEMAKRMRAISFDLMPSSLKNKGLETAIRDFVNSVTNTDLNIKLWFSNEQLQIDDYKIIHIYRIIKEIIHNTLKHARATELVLALKKETNELHIASQDNGIGFHYNSKLSESTGLGLRSLQNRVSLINGTIRIESEKGKGTSYLIQIPV